MMTPLTSIVGKNELKAIWMRDFKHFTVGQYVAYIEHKEAQGARTPKHMAELYETCRYYLRNWGEAAQPQEVKPQKTYGVPAPEPVCITLPEGDVEGLTASEKLSLAIDQAIKYLEEGAFSKTRKSFCEKLRLHFTDGYSFAEISMLQGLTPEASRAAIVNNFIKPLLRGEKFDKGSCPFCLSADLVTSLKGAPYLITNNYNRIARYCVA